MPESTNAAWGLPGRLPDLVENELDEGEELMWVGQPNPRWVALKFALKGLPALLVAIPWTVISLFLVVAAVSAARQSLRVRQNFMVFQSKKRYPKCFV
jgi:hypothetical protein